MNSIKNKLYAWILASVVISIFVTSAVFKSFLDDFYQEKSYNQITDYHGAFQKMIESTFSNILDVSKKLALQESIIFETNFIANYQDINNYDKNTFDTQKKSLLPIMKSFVDTAPVHGAALLTGEKDETPIAFYFKEYGSAIASYEEGQVNYIGDVANEKAFKILESIMTEEHLEILGSNLHKVNGSIFLDLHTPVYKYSRKGDRKRIGTLRILREIKGERISSFAARNSIAMSINILGTELKSYKGALKEESYFLSTRELRIGNDKFEMTYGISKDDMYGQFLSMEKSLGVLFALFALFIIPSIIYTFSKEVFRPLASLIKFGERIQKGDYAKVDEGYSVEFNHVVKTLNAMSQSIHEREKDLNNTINSLNECKKALDNSSIVSRGDINGDITYVNDVFCQVTGYRRSELMGRPHSILRNKEVPSHVFESMWRTIKDRKSIWTGYLSNVKKNGEIFHIKLTITPILDENGEIEEFLALRENVTELVDSRKELQKQYMTDSLTKLDNRIKLTSDLESNINLNLILINIDSFREINDFYGNEIGDKLLLNFSRRVENYFKESAYSIYRVQGDEFAVTIDEKETVDELLFRTNIFIKNIIDSPFIIDDILINIRATAGIAKNSDGKTFVHADLALKNAKNDKKDCEIYTSDNKVSEEYENNLLWTTKIKSAISEDRIVPYFQPIRNNKTGEIEKYESLVRLIGVGGEVVSPFFFLDIAKKSKLYHQITKIVIEKSFQHFFDKEYQFSINLSFEDLNNDATVNFILNSLKKYDISERVVFEIVESEYIEKYESITEFIKLIKSMGCKVAIDDFGTGYSNFEYLIKLNADYIKIDGSLIKDIVTDKNVFAVTQTVVDFAKKNDFKTIAEFVASEEIQEVVDKLGTDYSQGYLFGKPEESTK